MRGTGTLVLATLLLPLMLPAAGRADDASPEKYVLTDGRSFLGTYSAADGVMTIATPNGTLSFALTPGDIASHRRADDAELTARTDAPEPRQPPAADAAPASQSRSGESAKARLAKFTAITGLKDYPTLNASQRMAAITKLPDRMLGSWRAVDLVGEAPEQERARLVRLELDGTAANFSADFDLYQRAAARVQSPAAPAAGAAGARPPASRPLSARTIVKAFSCGSGPATTYVVTNDASGASGALITFGDNGTLVVTTMTRTPFAVNAQDCTVYKVVP